MSETRLQSSQLALLNNSLGIISFGATGNFTSGNNTLGSPITVVIPDGVTKILIIGQIRLQQQTGTQTDITAWVGMDGVTSCLRQNVVFTGANAGAATFTSSTCAIFSDATVTPGSHTFQVYATAAQPSNAGVCTIAIIPIGG